MIYYEEKAVFSNKEHYTKNVQGRGEEKT